MVEPGDEKKGAAVVQAMLEAAEQKLQVASELLVSRGGTMPDLPNLEDASLLLADARTLLHSAYTDQLMALQQELERLRRDLDLPCIPKRPGER